MQLRAGQPSGLQALLCAACLGVSLLSLHVEARGQDPFAAAIRPTEPRTPDEQAQAFHLPSGFQIQLFAAEPDIQKPMNIAFGADGRLWVSGSTEYPFAAEEGKGKDSIRVLEDTDGDGRADRSTVFADGLNIPIGLYPYGKGVIAYSIPNICYFEDTDGDGRCDKRTALYGPFDSTRDTHGMVNAFRRSYDGWIYACHGWANESNVASSTGQRLQLQSGNTFRFRVDGSDIERVTRGQVNPFGMTIDETGDLFNADCHTMPITLLIRDGCYECFGKPHDGLGFVPAVMNHSHDSTAIAGVVQYNADRFPPEYRGDMFVGNVMTSRVHRDTLLREGASVKAIAEADFIVSDDPWFRPVDMQVGPDGALYIADFYNRIIGHYEVPLDHPGRDRHRGRIWRVTYVQSQDSAATNSPDLSTAATADLIAALSHPVQAVRMRAMDELVDRAGNEAVEPITGILIDQLARHREANARVDVGEQDAAREDTDARTAVHALWTLQRLGGLTDKLLLNSMRDARPLVRIHAMRALGERESWSAMMKQSVLGALDDPDPLVRRAAAATLARHDTIRVAPEVLAALAAAPQDDPHLRHTLRIALRNQLRTPGTLSQLSHRDLEPAERELLADIALGLTGEEAGRFLVEFVKQQPASARRLEYVQHALRQAPADALAELVQIARDSAGDDVDQQLGLLRSLLAGCELRGLEPTGPMRQWGQSLAEQLLAPDDSEATLWHAQSLDDNDTNPWAVEKRRSTDGIEQFFLSSLPGGERRRSVLRSRTFEIPQELTFYVCGHLGPPPNDPLNENLVRLKLAASNEVVREVLAPRNDVARAVRWDLSEYVGQPGYLEIVDGIDASGYAWIAAGRFQPPLIAVPQRDAATIAEQQRAAAELAATLKLPELKPALAALMLSSSADLSSRAAAAEALSVIAKDGRRVLAMVIGEPSLPEDMRMTLVKAIAEPQDTSDPDAADQQLLSAALRLLPSRVQLRVAEQLAASPQGAAQLLQLVQQGAVSNRLLAHGSLQVQLQASVRDHAELMQQLAEATPAAAVDRQPLIRQRIEEFSGAQPSLSRGQQLFQQHCATCHRMRLRGALVGPQLDGIGNRGLERLAEDVLDPNQNVDAAFRTSVFVLSSGRVVTGLVRRHEGDSTIISDSQGQEQVIPSSMIEDQHVSSVSIMPDNWGEVLTAEQFADLAAYLLSQRQEPPTSVAWAATQIDARFRSEGVAAGDVNRDGRLDVMVGELWYEAPDWKPHEIVSPQDYGDGANSYSSAFLCFADDVNSDGWTDQIVVGFPGTPCYWYENPQGEQRHWQQHLIVEHACNETPLYVDLFNTGQRVLLMAWHPPGAEQLGQMAWFTPREDPTQPWQIHPISPPSNAQHAIPGSQRFSHGLGVGDMDQDGRLDVLCTEGWWQQPAAADVEFWTFHAASLGPACANMYCADINGDGRTDVLSSSAHQYGIWWHEQRVDEDGEPSFVTHDLFPDLVSQTHALQYHDLDGDGLKDLVTGKRWWAHGPAGDPGSDQPATLHWFQAVREDNGTIRFIPRLVHGNSGVGLQFEVLDFNRDGLLDVLTSNKKGVNVFHQVRP